MNKHAAYGHGGDSPYCCFHPRELVVGVCAHCLKDRLLLLLLAATTTDDRDRVAALRRKTSSSSSISLPKVFALGSSFLQRLDSRHHHHRPDVVYSDDTTSVASLDDSFISIKFEDNGKATWAKAATNTKAAESAGPPAPPVLKSSSTAVMVEHVTRWRKQVVGRLLQLARWRRSAASKAVGLDGKKDWIGPPASLAAGGVLVVHFDTLLKSEG